MDPASLGNSFLRKGRTNDSPNQHLECRLKVAHLGSDVWVDCCCCCCCCCGCCCCGWWCGGWWWLVVVVVTKCIEKRCLEKIQKYYPKCSFDGDESHGTIHRESPTRQIPNETWDLVHILSTGCFAKFMIHQPQIQVFNRAPFSVQKDPVKVTPLLLRKINDLKQCCFGKKMVNIGTTLMTLQGSRL